MKPLKIKVSLTLDNDVVDILKDLAEADDRSFSQLVNRILKTWISEQNGNTEPSNDGS